MHQEVQERCWLNHLYMMQSWRKSKAKFSEFWKTSSQWHMTHEVFFQCHRQIKQEEWLISWSHMKWKSQSYFYTRLSSFSFSKTDYDREDSKVNKLSYQSWSQINTDFNSSLTWCWWEKLFLHSTWHLQCKESAKKISS